MNVQDRLNDIESKIDYLVEAQEKIDAKTEAKEKADEIERLLIKKLQKWIPIALGAIGLGTGGLIYSNGDDKPYKSVLPLIKEVKK